MTRDPQQVSPDQPSLTAELVDRLSRFEGPPEQFLANLLAVQCYIAAAENGTILRLAPDGSTEVLAVHPPVPPGTTAPSWLGRTVEAAPGVLSAGSTAIKPLHDREDLYGQPARRHLVMIPLRSSSGFTGLASFVVDTGDASVLRASRERLELTVSLLSLYELRLSLQRRQVDLRRLRSAMETLSAVNEHDRFAGGAMTFCNELASRYQSDRVSLGFLKGRYVHLRAMSHTEKFSRKMKLVQDIEATQEECLDQDVEIIHPAGQDATFVNRFTKELSTRHGPTAVVSLPLRRESKPCAVVTLERPAEKPFAAEEVESLRLTCELCTARVVNLYEHDRWIGAHAAAGMRKGLAALIGPKHTWIKALGLLGVLVVVFLLFAKGPYRAEAPFALEATRQQVLSAPFDGYLKSVSVRPGDSVEGGRTVLATLETAELRLQLASAQAEQLGYAKQAAAALRDRKTAEAQIAQAQADKAAAQARLLEYEIRQASIVSPVGGSVITGDLERRIGAAVKTGEVLFEVAPLESLRAEISVPEEDIADVRESMEGELATASYPERRIAFTVERINPAAEVVNQRNVFKVRAQLHERPSWLRPGMEGVAKISIAQRHYAWVWTRKLINWVRMKLWW